MMCNSRRSEQHKGKEKAMRNEITHFRYKIIQRKNQVVKTYLCTKASQTISSDRFSNLMNQSLAYLVKENPSHFWGLRTEVCHFSNGKMCGAFKMEDSKVNNSAIEMYSSRLVILVQRNLWASFLCIMCWVTCEFLLVHFSIFLM